MDAYQIDISCSHKTREDEYYCDKLTKLLSNDLDFHDKKSDYASHNFHSFPAKFPPQLPRKFIEGLTRYNDVVLDPMMGSGTTIVEAFLTGRRSIGTDIDYLSLLISKVKNTTLNKKHIYTIGKSIIDNAKFNIHNKRNKLNLLFETKFDNITKEFINYWFLYETQLELLAIISEIDKISDSNIRAFFRLIFSAIIITKSGGVSLALDLAHTRPHRGKMVITKTEKFILNDNSERKSSRPMAKTINMKKNHKEIIMGAHIFLVGEDNYEVCIHRGIYGCVMPSSERNRAEVIAGILSIEPNDLVFFYVKNRGIYGLWKVIEEPYFDETKIWADNHRLFPYRFSFEPTVGYFPRAVSLSDVLDLRDKGRIWTFDLNPVQQKNQYKITMDEARELLRLILRNNPIRQQVNQIIDRYIPIDPIKIKPEINSIKKGRFQYEGWLNAWFMASLAKGEMKQFFGDYREFLNLVPTTFNKVMDILLTHVTTINSMDILYKYTCIELKTDRATELDLTQILRYEDWLARKLAAGDNEMIQSVLIAYRFADSVIDYVNKRRRIEEKTVNFISYKTSEDMSNIELSEDILKNNCH